MPKQTAEKLSSSQRNITNHAYNIVLDYYSKVTDLEDRRGRIESLLSRMEEWADHLDNSDVRPDRISYAALLRAIVEENGDGFVEEVDEIVRRMEMSDRPSMLPDTNIYAIALDAFFKSGDKKEVLVRAKRLFWHIQKDSPLLPDEILYTLLMKIYSAAGDADGSNRILFEMIEAFESGREDCCPTELSFVTAMSSWEHSK